MSPLHCRPLLFLLFAATYLPSSHCHSLLAISLFSLFLLPVTFPHLAVVRRTCCPLASSGILPPHSIPPLPTLLPHPPPSASFLILLFLHCLLFLPLPPPRLTYFPSHSSSSLSLWYIPMYVFWYIGTGWYVLFLLGNDTIPRYKIVILDFYLFLVS